MASIRICEVCLETIDEERAEGLPKTRLCRQHAKEIEKFGGELRTVSRQERTSKATSLKINYGGIETQQRRNPLAIERLKEEYQQGQQAT